jgi:hypothetical protein
VDKLGRTDEFIGIVMHKTYADRWIHGKVEVKLGRTGGFMDKWWTRLRQACGSWKRCEQSFGGWANSCTSGGQGLEGHADSWTSGEHARANNRIHIQARDKVLADLRIHRQVVDKA